MRMTDHVTPDQARALISHDQEHADHDYTAIDTLVDAAATNKLARLAWDMSEMIARARYEYAIARRTDTGVEYETQFFEWIADPNCAGWTVNFEGLENAVRDNEFIARRLVIDLPEEEA